MSIGSSAWKLKRTPLLLTAASCLAFGFANYKTLQNRTTVLNANPVQEKKKVLKVCVTGAAGHVGTSFVPMLASGDVFGSDVRVHLKLLDVPQQEYMLKGIQLELQDCAYPTLYDVEIGANPRKMFRDIDVGVFIGGSPRMPGMELQDLLQTNSQIFKDQGDALNTNAKSSVKCVVVANPANTNAAILKEYAQNIPAENFTSLSRLDQNRAVAQIAQKAAVNPQEVKNVVVWGNHSHTLFPDVNHGTIHQQNIRKVINNDKYLDKDFVEKVQNRGNEVLEVKRISSSLSGAKAIRDHLKDWYFGTPEGSIVSMGVVSDGSYGVPKGVMCSLPVKTGNFEYKIAKDLKLDDFSKQKIRKSVEELIHEFELAMGSPAIAR